MMSDIGALRGRRVLSIMGRVPWPMDDGWKMRSGNLLRQLVERGAKVDLVAFGHAADADHEERIAGLHALHLLPRVRSYATSDLIAGALGRTPFSVLNYRDDALGRFLVDLSSRDSFDVLMIEDVVMAQYAQYVRAHVKLLDMHNVESHLMQRYADGAPFGARRLYAKITAAKLARYERVVSEGFDMVLVCSELDQQRLSAMDLRTDIFVAPNGIDPARYAVHSDQAEDGSLLFVGSMDYHANLSGVQHFLEKIFPLVLEKAPHAVVKIVGKNPPKQLVSLSNDHIVVTGAVPDVRPYLARASVVIVPLTVGGGTRLKILEAMAAGKPIVSTRVGCEGITVHHGQTMLIADDPREFADCVVALSQEPTRARSIGLAARDAVLESYDWRSIVDKIEREVAPRLLASS